MIWQLSHRADPAARAIADRHYSRQKPGTPQFVPPGRCVVLYAQVGTTGAYWVTSWPFGEYVKHRWPGAWVCSAFRNEGIPKTIVQSSDMVRQAWAATRAIFGEPPPEGAITFIDPDKVRDGRKSGRQLGRCFILAGGEYDGETKGGLVAIKFRPEQLPPADAPYGAAFRLLA